MTVSEKKKKNITIKHIREGRNDYIALASVLNDLSDQIVARPPSYSNEDVLQVIEYWIENELFIPTWAQSKTGNETYKPWEGDTQEYIERFRKMATQDDELQNNMWEVWFELTEHGDMIEDMDDLP